MKLARLHLKMLDLLASTFILKWQGNHVEEANQYVGPVIPLVLSN
jgi:hypothetical protein